MATTYHADIQKLYVAYFNRPADYAGLQHWEGVVEAAAGNTAGVAAAFAASDEYKAAYAGMDAYHVVGAVYQNIFGHAADVPGLTFWAQGLIRGDFTIAQAVTTIAAGAQGSDKVAFDSKVAAATAFTNALDTTAEILGYSGAQANLAAKAFIGSITTAESLAAALVPAALAASVDAVVKAGTPIPPTTVTNLTVGLDTILGGAGIDIINASLENSLSAFDSIDGGAGADTLNVLTTGTAIPGGVSIKNVETVNINTSGAGYTVDASTFTGLTQLNLANSAQAAGNIVVNGGGAVSVNAIGATTGGITVGATAAPTGAVTIAQGVSIIGGAAAAAINVTGGSTVSVAQTATGTGAGVATQSAVTVTGTAATTAVTVAQSASVTAVPAVVAATETAAITINAAGLTAGQSVTIAGLTYTSTAATSQAQLVAAFASLAAGATTGAGTATGTYSGALTGWSTGAAAGFVITATSTTASANVANIVEVDANNAVDAIVTTDGAAAVANVTGIAAGNVVINDVSAASATAAGKITSVNLSNFGAATVNSGALNSVTLAGAGTSLNVTAGALTTPTVSAIGVNLNGATVGAVTLDADYKTVNIVSNSPTATGGNSVGLTATGATALNISGDKNVTVTAQSLAATAAIVSTSTANVTLTGALAVGQSYTGGAGVDTISVAALGTKAIATGAGADVVTYGGALAAGGTIDAGEGVDTISMTAAAAVTATATATFAATVSNFEVLSLSDAIIGATAINMVNADGMNNLSINGATGGGLTVTGAAADFTLTQRAASTVANSVALLSDAGTSDNVNLAFAAGNGFTNTVALTVAGVESIKITTTDTSAAVANTAQFVTPITAAAATTVTVAGAIGVDLTGGMTQTVLTSLDASGLTGTGAAGGLTFTSGALAAAATIKGSAAGTNNVTFTAATKGVTYTGGTGADTVTVANAQTNVVTLGDGANTFNGTGSTGTNTITGGAGIDLITIGAGVNTVVAGAGNDIITITGAAAGLNTIDVGAGNDTVVFQGIQSAAGYYTSITGMGAGDKIDLSVVGTIAAEATLGTKITLGAVSSFANYLDAAVAANASGAVNWFQFNGNTYITVDNAAGATFADGADIVIELVGLVDISKAVVAAEVITFA